MGSVETGTGAWPQEHTFIPVHSCTLCPVSKHCKKQKLFSCLTFGKSLYCNLVPPRVYVKGKVRTEAGDLIHVKLVILKTCRYYVFFKKNINIHRDELKIIIKNLGRYWCVRTRKSFRNPAPNTWAFARQHRGVHAVCVWLSRQGSKAVGPLGWCGTCGQSRGALGVLGSNLGTTDALCCGRHSAQPGTLHLRNEKHDCRAKGRTEKVAEHGAWFWKILSIIEKESYFCISKEAGDQMLYGNWKPRGRGSLEEMALSPFLNVRMYAEEGSRMHSLLS